MNLASSRSAAALAIALTAGSLAAFVPHKAPALEPTAAPAQPLTEKLPRVPAKSAAEEAQTFRTLDGFRMDLLAAEPLVASPVAMTYDENGRAYVCEMRDYPYTDKAHHKPGQENPTDAPIGRIRLLEDTDGDGKFDKATIFAEGLSWPTGIACWKGGVFVAATPDQVLVIVGDTSSLRVKAELDERDVGRIKVGQQAIVRADAFQGQDFTGRAAVA